MNPHTEDWNEVADAVQSLASSSSSTSSRSQVTLLPASNRQSTRSETRWNDRSTPSATWWKTQP